jgi:FMN phosphatase YigB (HAD superfamily)
VLFVDDRADNLAGAATVGLGTLHFEGPGALDRLRALVAPAA